MLGFVLCAFVRGTTFIFNLMECTAILCGALKQRDFSFKSKMSVVAERPESDSGKTHLRLYIDF